MLFDSTAYNLIPGRCDAHLLASERTKKMLSSISDSDKGTSLVLVGPQVRAAALWARFTVDVGIDVGLQVGDNGSRYAG
jgi:hypothetical protein